MHPPPPHRCCSSPVPEAGFPWRPRAAAVAMAASAWLASGWWGGFWCRAPVPAGSARHWRTTGSGCYSGAVPNSGTSDALGHSGTGVVGGVGGVEEVLVVVEVVVVVVVVRSRYH